MDKVQEEIKKDRKEKRGDGVRHADKEAIKDCWKRRGEGPGLLSRESCAEDRKRERGMCRTTKIK